ncbi:hypothetical protein SODALDRAFT_204143 [Sodiomyces alkalinus F11]|uniref:Uncharacterized protein n=1 Tax=Sodiomyces alkalinus (strain CBS 110278 / VKM F-3762 / F11) TaxID=1314773 RepID=A0A3N2PTG9_SODAK|nr:hypothetical protein SODALDRAFT_204143 [Sodiomyces alkalinus F11]ROT37724.1 hypothetical protein SODALDRAFT_204143 [Sodiomyces alkalinus F11]
MRLCLEWMYGFPISSIALLGCHTPSSPIYPSEWSRKRAALAWADHDRPAVQALWSVK